MATPINRGPFTPNSNTPVMAGDWWTHGGRTWQRRVSAAAANSEPKYGAFWLLIIGAEMPVEEPLPFARQAAFEL